VSSCDSLLYVIYFTKSLKALPALNAGTLQAAILIFSPFPLFMRIKF